MSKHSKTNRTQNTAPQPTPTPVVEPVATEGQEPKPVRQSVVADRFKERYGKAGNNGDWFASWMLAHTMNPDGTVNTAAVRELAAENGYNDEALIKNTNGWQGRHRMTVGNVLRTRVRKNGFFLHQGQEVRS